MATARIHVDGLDKLSRRLRTEIPDAVSRAIAKTLQRSALLIEGDARRAAPVDTGRLRSSITHTPMITDRFVIGFAIGSNVHYAKFVEFGTGRRGAASSLTVSAREGMQEDGYSHGPSAGQTAHPFLFPAFERRRNAVADEIAKAIEEATAVPV